MSASSPRRLRTTGKLRVYLGYAAGVGKTYRMLDEARKAARSGVDVVIGYFEPHGRKDTIEKTAGTGDDSTPEDLLSRRHLRGDGHGSNHGAASGGLRGGRIRSHQRARVAARQALGGRAALLDAGIDVLTTVNVQHIESLNDQVWQVTGVRPRETVPDWVMEEADEIVLVDLTPRALMHRLERGVVYRRDKARQALENFFTETNLTALRELALRQTAHQVEDHHGDTSSERIMIHLTRASVHGNADPPWQARRRLSARGVSGGLCGQGGLTDQNGDVERHLGFARSLHIDTSVCPGKTCQAIAEFARRAQSDAVVHQPRIRARRRKIVDKVREMQVTVVAERPALMPKLARYFSGRRTGFRSRPTKTWLVSPVASLRPSSARRIS